MLGRIVGVVTLGLVFGACADSSHPTAAFDLPTEGVQPASVGSVGVIASVTGSGHRVLQEGASDRVVRKFTVTANGMSDGSASGRYNLVLGSADLQLRGGVSCVNVVGNRAFVGGDVDPGYLAKIFPPPIAAQITGVALELVDHGEGPGAAPDEVSRIGLFLANPDGPQDWCDAAEPGPVDPIDFGNIQVR